METASTDPLRPSDEELAMLGLGGPEWVKNLHNVVREKELYAAPPATDTDLRAWEDAYGIKLPAEYRFFLRYICRELWDSKDEESCVICGLSIPQESDVLAKEKKRMSTPFPVQREIQYSLPPDMMDSDEPIDRDYSGESNNYEHELEEYQGKTAKTWLEADTGTLRLRGEDDGDEWFVLVLTGPQRGIVWNVLEVLDVDSTGSIQLVPVGTFAEWVAHPDCFRFV